MNPGNENSTHVAAHDTLSTAPVGAIGLRQDTGIGILDLDNLIVGTAFTNVVTVTQPAAIPVQIRQLGNSVILSWTNPAFALQASPHPDRLVYRCAGGNQPLYEQPLRISTFLPLGILTVATPLHFKRTASAVLFCFRSRNFSKHWRR